MKNIYIVRHCKATGQEPEAGLTGEGEREAERLADFFSTIQIDQIISSPYVRAIKSIHPFADGKQLPIQTDARLEERKLCVESLPDWMEKLRQTFDDLDMCLKGGESSRTAMKRGVEVVKEVLAQEAGTTILVSHGNLITLILKHFDERFGFNEWKEMSNPDVFLLEIEEERASVKSIWKEYIEKL